jgi:hypothetical protein
MGFASSVKSRRMSGVVVAAYLLWAGSALAGLPTYLDHGFPLDTFEPAPAGDRFVVVPDAVVRDSASVRLAWDYAWNPLELRVGSTAINPSSFATYGHIGVAGAWVDIFQLSLDAPAVLSQSLGDLNLSEGFNSGSMGTAASTGDLGDMRVGLRVSLPKCALPESWRKNDAGPGLEGDFWLPTGNADALSGDPEARFRILALWSGGVPVSFGIRGTLEYAVGVGYQQYFASAGDVGVARGMPIRGGVALKVLALRIGSGEYFVRPSVEYTGVPFMASGTVARNTQELVTSLGVPLPEGLMVAFSWGTGLSAAAGSPEGRFAFTFQYRGVYQPKRYFDGVERPTDDSAPPFLCGGSKRADAPATFQAAPCSDPPKLPSGAQEPATGASPGSVSPSTAPAVAPRDVPEPPQPAAGSVSVRATGGATPAASEPPSSAAPR